MHGLERDNNAIGFELRVVTNLIRRKVEQSNAHQKVSRMTGMHGWVIGYLFENRDTDVFQRDLENRFSIRRPTATKILQLMEANGLINRVSVDYDARLKKLVLTDKAYELHKMISEDINQLEQTLVRGIDEDEVAAFMSTLHKIKMNLE